LSGCYYNFQQLWLPVFQAIAKKGAVKFSIVTPSFRNPEWLKLRIASVADQQGVSNC
jgi:hypothetical protein